MSFESIGYMAAFCTTFSFLPQAIKTIRSGDTEALSLGMYSVFTLGVFMWIIYGLAIGNKAVTLANIVTGIFASIILFSKIRNEVRNVNSSE